MYSRLFLHVSLNVPILGHNVPILVHLGFFATDLGQDDINRQFVSKILD
jgi:hypothetical protein